MLVHDKAKAGMAMKKFWPTLGWIVTISIQILISFIILEIFRATVFPLEITMVREFLIIPLAIWLSFTLGAYGAGILGLMINKSKPFYAGLRFISTAVMAVIPMLILIFLGLSVGIENTQDFQEIVLGRMVPYYTQLNVVFSILGFYLPSWFKNFKSKKP